MVSIDLNCDLGESFGRFRLGEDAAIMALISSANVACGFHAGDPDVMAATIKPGEAERCCAWSGIPVTRTCRDLAAGTWPYPSKRSPMLFFIN